MLRVLIAKVMCGEGEHHLADYGDVSLNLRKILDKADNDVEVAIDQCRNMFHDRHGHPILHKITLANARIAWE